VCIFSVKYVLSCFNVVDTKQQFISGVVDTDDRPSVVAIFFYKSKRPQYRIVRGPREIDSWEKKPEVAISCLSPLCPTFCIYVVPFSPVELSKQVLWRIPEKSSRPGQGAGLKTTFLYILFLRKLIYTLYSRVQRIWLFFRKWRIQTLWWVQNWNLKHIYKLRFWFFQR
jgi:hypothetical protein